MGIHQMYADLMSEFYEARKERDQLRTEVERLKGVVAATVETARRGEELRRARLDRAEALLSAADAVYDMPEVRTFLAAPSVVDWPAIERTAAEVDEWPSWKREPIADALEVGRLAIDPETLRCAAGTRHTSGSKTCLCEPKEVDSPVAGEADTHNRWNVVHREDCVGGVHEGTGCTSEQEFQAVLREISQPDPLAPVWAKFREIENDMDALSSRQAKLADWMRDLKMEAAPPAPVAEPAHGPALTDLCICDDRRTCLYHLKGAPPAPAAIPEGFEEYDADGPFSQCAACYPKACGHRKLLRRKPAPIVEPPTDGPGHAATRAPKKGRK